MRAEERGGDLLSCVGHAPFFLTSQHLLGKWTGLSPEKVKHRFFSILHPTPMMDRCEKHLKGGYRETTHVGVGLACLGNSGYGKGLGVDLSFSLGVGSNWPDASHTITPESCSKNRHPAPGVGELESAGNAVGGAGRESK